MKPLLPAIAGVLLVVSASACPAQTPPDLADALGRLPFGKSPIDYYGKETSDPAAKLDARLAAGKVRLAHQGPQGYLRSLLGALEVPVESQLLVFSKTSLNERIIHPRNPRAVYFNDNVYVGWVDGSPAIEVSAVDPQKGAMFYTLSQDAERPPRLVREERCIVCHASTTALGVPGHLVRSFATTKTGKILSGYSQVTHDTPFSDRWGGWYVTGRTAGLPHLGNLVGKADHAQHRRQPAFRGSVTDLRPFYDVQLHLTPHSDVVALMVLDHQVHMHNLLTRLNFETRLGMKSDIAEKDIAEQVVRYMLFVDAPPLEKSVEGTSGFAAWFAKQGPTDRRGRSLRQLDLKARLLKHPLSYLIYSPAFHGLPAAAKSKVYRRLWDVLSAPSAPKPYSSLPTARRRLLIEMLRDTQKELPAYWKG